MRIDKSDPRLHSELCESQMDDETGYGGLNVYLTFRSHLRTTPILDRTVKTESPPTLRERLRNMIVRITHWAMICQTRINEYFMSYTSLRSPKRY